MTASRLALRRSFPGARSFQRLARVGRGGIGAFEWLKPAWVARFWPPTASVPVVRLALMFHPPVLEPNFNLPLGQVQERGNLHSPGPAEVLVKVELLLQLQ